jgi:regulatory protein
MASEGRGSTTRSAGRRRSADQPAGPGGHPEDPLGDPEAVARAVCLQLLTAAPRTRAELADKLARRGVPDEAANTVLARFGEVGLIDDATFAEAWVASRHHGRGLAPRALAAELRRKGVDHNTITEAVAQVDADAQEEMARQLVRRKLRSGAGSPDAVRRRLLGMLARKGYSSGLAYRVVREETAAFGDDDPLADFEPLDEA